MHALLNIAIKSSSCVPYMYMKRGFDLNINLKTTLPQGAGIVCFGEREIGAYISLYSNKILD